MTAFTVPFLPPSAARALGVMVVCAALVGCEIPGVWPDPRIAAREADGRAIGGACRHALRGIEDCYILNPKAQRSAVFAGWKDMDEYMREHKVEGKRTTAGGTDKEEPQAEPVKPASASKEKAPAADAKRPPAGTKT